MAFLLLLILRIFTASNFAINPLTSNEQTARTDQHPKDRSIDHQPWPILYLIPMAETPKE